MCIHVSPPTSAALRAQVARHGELPGILLDDADASMDGDAARAYRTFRRNVWLVCRNGSECVRDRGRVAMESYRVALAAATDPAGPAWRHFVRAVWTLLSELDRYPSGASRRWRDARGALNRIVYDNVDLLETPPAARRRQYELFARR